MKMTELYRKATEITLQAVLEIMNYQTNTRIFDFNIKQNYKKYFSFNAKNSGYRFDIDISPQSISAKGYDFSLEGFVCFYSYDYNQEDDHELVLAEYKKALLEQIKETYRSKNIEE